MKGPSLDHLSAEDKSTYEENADLIQTLQEDLKKKKEQYKNNQSMYDRFAPGIISSIKELAAENKELLEAKVCFIFNIHSKQTTDPHVSIHDHLSTWIVVCTLLFQKATTEAYPDGLPVENRKAYKENLDFIDELKEDLVTKQKKYQDDPQKYDHFIPSIISSIEQLETDNKNLLDAKVSYL